MWTHMLMYISTSLCCYIAVYMGMYKQCFQCLLQESPPCPKQVDLSYALDQS